MTIEDIIKANGGTVSKQSGESADTGTKSTSRISEIIAANKEAADKQLAVRNVPKMHGGASGKSGVDAKRDDGAVKIHALGAGETKPTTSRVGKTINAGVQSTMSNFTNFWGWLKESDAAARARDEADKEYTERQNKQLAETKGEKAIAKTEEQQKQKYAENHAKQKDNWSKDYEEADKLSAMSEKNVAEAKEGLGKVGQALVDIGVVGTQMLGDAVLNIIPGGGTASMIARVAGAGAQQARLEGKDIGQQSLSAIKSGGIAWLTEKMFGAFGKLYGKGAADDVVEAVVRKIGKTNAGKNFLRLGLNALGEGAEEITEDLLNAAADRALKLGDGELDLGEVLYDGFLGFALGGLGAGTQILNGNYRIKNEIQQRVNAQKVLAKTVAESTADPETVKTAEAMMQKLNDDEMLTTAEAETLAGALEASTSVEETAETVQQGEVAPNEEKPLTPVEAVVRAAKGEAGATQENTAADPIIAQEATTAIEQAQEVPAQKSDYVPKAIKNAPKYQNANPYTGNAAIANKLPSKIATILKRAKQVVVSRAKINGAEVNFVTDGRLVYFVDDNVAEQAISSYGNTPSPNLSRIVEGFANAKDTTLLSEAPVVIKPDDSKIQIAVFKIDGNYSAYDVKFLKALDGGRLYIAKGEKWDTLIATDKDGNISGFALPIRMTDELIVKADVAFSDREQSNLPEGMGAASAEFTGEMTPAEKWVAEAQGKGDNALHNISDATQRNLAEQQGRAPQEMPKVDLNGMLTSKTANTAQNSGVTTQEMSDAILNDAANSRFSYYAYSDEEALTKAKDEIDAEGWDNALTKYQADVARGIVSKDMTVKGIVLYNNAVSSGDYVTALNILDGMVKTSRDAAQAMQAVNILNKLSPETRLYCICRGIDGIKRQVQKKYGKKAPDIEIDEALLTDYVQKMRNGDTEAAEAVWENIQQNIADQIPASWVDKLNAWRYLAMLGNPRTHIRNTFGNAFFAIPVMVKNVVSTGIEAGVDKLSKNGIQRTKAVLNPLTNKQDRALYATAMADYANASEQILAGGKYDDIFSGVSDKQTIFQFKPLEAVRKFNSKALDKEDVWFAQPHYATALAGYLKANGISAVEFTNGSMSGTAMNEARNYAIKEAQKATFRDINPFSEMISNLGKSKSKVVNAATSAILPFKKTPANILVRGVEYSPIGLMKGLVDIRNIKTPNNPNGTKTAAEVIDELAAGLTGTGLVALGALLVRSGALTGGGGDDDKENKFQSLQGRQNYALVLPDGTTVTLDWLAPEVLPVFVGAELYNSMSGNGNSWENILAAISTIPQPMLDMSLLQSVNDLIDNVAYAKEGKGIYKIIAGMATSLLSQFVPTVLGQVERTIETERQQTFIDRSENAPSSAVQSFWARLNDKNPFYDYNKIPYIDAWGRTEETGTFAERFANNFFNPAYVKEASGTPIDSELQRLYGLGKTSVYPTKPGTDVKINGEYLSAEEYVEYAKKRGSVSLETVRELINSSAYKNMSDADKADAIKAAYDYADDIAKRSVRPKAEIPSWVEKATASGNPSQYMADTIIMRSADADGNDRYSNAEKVRGFMNGGYSGGELVEKVREYMTTDNGNCRLGDMLEKAQSVKVPDTVTLNVYEFYNNTNSKDASGNTVPGLKKERVQQYINSLNSLTAEQKSMLYYSLYKK